MFENTQLLKGPLEACILKIIEKQVTYGYEIIEELKRQGFQEVKEGTIYPLLVRLEKRAFISSETKPSPLGPKRKYYCITEDGERYAQEFLSSWRDLDKIIKALFDV